MHLLWLRLALLLLLTLPVGARAAASPFDLQGPTLDVEVARAGRTLPIGEVPNLAEGDRIVIKAQFPAGQSVHYLLIAAFLRGATNPPPQDWFFQSQTWTPKGREGLAVTAPPGAQQVLVFLAPQTGGDFKTLVNAVRARPGAFVRASQDLNQASLDRSRLNAFLAGVRAVSQDDPGQLKTVSPLLARSLTIKLDTDCLQKALVDQAACLTQNQDALVLDDGHSTSIVQALTSGSFADLAQALSTTPQAGGGYFSPYVSSVLDMAHIFESFHTARYQYIPALASEDGAKLALLLNAPPSFQNPKSVLVAALPAIEPAQAPPLHALDPEVAACLEAPGLTLAADGAPLVFSTAYAHDLALRLKTRDGRMVDLPVRADPRKGGLVVAATPLEPAAFGPEPEGVLHGFWGFDPYEGPRFRLQSVQDRPWRVAAEAQQALVAGREASLRLEAAAPACVQTVSLADGPARVAGWKAAGSDGLLVDLDLKAAEPGPLSLLIHPYGGAGPEPVALRVYAAAGRFDGFVFHAGDSAGELKGARLQDVQSLEFGGVQFRPGPAPADADGLVLTAADAQAAAGLKTGLTQAAKVTLQDGRTLRLTAAVLPPRPKTNLIGKSLTPVVGDSEGAGRIVLTDPDELPRGAVLTFSIRSEAPLTSAARVEVASADGAFSAALTGSDGLILQDPHVAVATLDAGRAFGASAFGPLRFRVVDAGAAGDWQPLATLVRLPIVKGLHCRAAGDPPCRLDGQELFLIQALADNPAFAPKVETPDGFPGAALPAPRPRDGRLYIRLRDDPAAANLLRLPGAEAASGGP